MENKTKLATFTFLCLIIVSVQAAPVIVKLQDATGPAERKNTNDSSISCCNITSCKFRQNCNNVAPVVNNSAKFNYTQINLHNANIKVVKLPKDKKFPPGSSNNNQKQMVVFNGVISLPPKNQAKITRIPLEGNKNILVTRKVHHTTTRRRKKVKSTTAFVKRTTTQSPFEYKRPPTTTAKSLPTNTFQYTKSNTKKKKKTTVKKFEVVGLGPSTSKLKPARTTNSLDTSSMRPNTASLSNDYPDDKGTQQPNFETTSANSDGEDEVTVRFGTRPSSMASSGNSETTAEKLTGESKTSSPFTAATTSGSNKLTTASTSLNQNTPVEEERDTESDGESSNASEDTTQSKPPTTTTKPMIVSTTAIPTKTTPQIVSTPPPTVTTPKISSTVTAKISSLVPQTTVTTPKISSTVATKISSVVSQTTVKTTTSASTGDEEDEEVSDGSNTTEQNQSGDEETETTAVTDSIPTTTSSIVTTTIKTLGDAFNPNFGVIDPDLPTTTEPTTVDKSGVVDEKLATTPFAIPTVSVKYGTFLINEYDDVTVDLDAEATSTVLTTKISALDIFGSKFGMAPDDSTTKSIAPNTQTSVPNSAATPAGGISNLLNNIPGGSNLLNQLGGGNIEEQAKAALGGAGNILGNLGSLFG